MSTLWLKYMQHGHDASSVMKWGFFHQPSLRLCWSQNVQKMVLSRVFPVFVCSFWATIVCGGSTWQTPRMTVDLKGSFWGLIHTKCSISIRMQVYPSIWIEVLRFGCSVKTTGYAERKTTTTTQKPAAKKLSQIQLLEKRHLISHSLPNRRQIVCIMILSQLCPRLVYFMYLASASVFVCSLCC